ncbi:MAG: hypothetical protein KGQ59_09080, partial [Bdellovibrionales bacterium]|nr:hypothetical protein [Bdellovibrionales bacterium]
ESSERPFSGSGTSQDDPFIICNIEQLNYVRFFPVAYFLVKGDIDASATQPGTEANLGSIWEADDYYADVANIEEDADIVRNKSFGFKPIEGFKGIFDGNRKVIRNLFVAPKEGNLVGLFSSLFADSGQEVAVVNLGIEDSIFYSRTRGTAAGVFSSGLGSNARLEGVYVKNSVVGGAGSAAGGLVGEMTYSAAILNSFSDNLVIDSSGKIGSWSVGRTFYSGGLVGVAIGGTIARSYAARSQFGVGASGSPSVVAGGLVGLGYGSGLIIENSFADPLFSNLRVGFVKKGGLIGEFPSDTSALESIQFAYRTSAAGGVGAAATRKELMSPSPARRHAVYKEHLAWDFSEVWSFVPGLDYPQLVGALDPEPLGRKAVACSPSSRGNGVASDLWQEYLESGYPRFGCRRPGGASQ